jgi:hypothetical protein
MNRALLFALSLCVLLVPLSVRAESKETPVPMPKDFTPAVYDKTVLVCKREKVTGSRLSKKVCMTKAQRDEVRESSRDALEEVQRETPPHKG